MSHMVRGVRTLAVVQISVLTRIFAKKVNILISFESTLFDSEPSSEQMNRKSLPGDYGGPSSSWVSSGSRKLLAKKTGAVPLVFWLPLASSL